MQSRPDKNEFLTVEQLKRIIRNTWKKVDEAHAKKASMSDARAAMKGLALTILDDLEINRTHLEREEIQAILTGLDLFSDHHAEKDYSGYSSYIAPAKGGYLSNGSAYLKAKDNLKREAIEKQKAIKEATDKGQIVQDDVIDYKELSQSSKIYALNKFRNYLMTCKPLEELQKAAQKVAADNKARAEALKARQAELVAEEKAQQNAAPGIVKEEVKEEANVAAIAAVEHTALTEKEMQAQEAKRQEEEQKAVEAKKLEAYKKITLSADEVKELHHDEKKALELFTTMSLAKEINGLLTKVKASDFIKPTKKTPYWKDEIHQMAPENKFKPVTLKHVVTKESQPIIKNNTVKLDSTPVANPVPSPLSVETMAAIHSVNPEHHRQAKARAEYVQPYIVTDVKNDKKRVLDADALAIRNKKIFDWAKAADAYTVSSKTKAGVKKEERRATWLVDESYYDNIPSLRVKRDIRGQDPGTIQARAASIKETNEHYRAEYQRLLQDGLKALYEQDVNNIELYRKAEAAKDENKLNELHRAGLLLLVKKGVTTYEEINALERTTHYFAPNSEVVMNEYLQRPEPATFKFDGIHDTPTKWGAAKKIETGYTNVKPTFEEGKKGYTKLPRHLQKAMPPVYLPIAEERLLKNDQKAEKDREKGLVWYPKSECQVDTFDSSSLIASEAIKHPAPATETSQEFAKFQPKNYANVKNSRVAKPGTNALNKTISDVVPQVEPVQAAQEAKVEDAALVARRKLFNESKETKSSSQLFNERNPHFYVQHPDGKTKPTDAKKVKVADKSDTRPIHQQITNPKGLGLFGMGKSKEQLRRLAVEEFDKNLQEKMEAQYKSNFAKR